MKAKFLVAALVVATLSFAHSPVSAASSGLAWDSVTKVAMNADASSLQPGSFDQDFAQAATVQPPPESTGGGMFAGVNKAMAMGQHMQALIQNGFAERHYVAGSKERTDQLSEQTATITDCAARTITTLDLRKKTYRVVSMDQGRTSSSASGASAPQPRPTDDGSRISIVIANTALGSRVVGGQSTSGFKSDMSFTDTKPSGESQTFNGNLLAYYSNYSNPAPTCTLFATTSTSADPNSGARAFSAMTMGYARFTGALALAGLDKRFTIKESGPALPRGKLAMYEAATIGGGQRGGGTFITERGNVRAVSADDPIFSVPADFTREQ